MATVHYTAKAKDSRTLELPEEAQELGLQPGDEVTVSVDSSRTQKSFLITSSAEGLSVMRQTAQRHKDRRVTDNSATQRLLQEARKERLTDMSQPSNSLPGAVVVDANVPVAIAANEPGGPPRLLPSITILPNNTSFMPLAPF
jgi:antitoxin component of MazEF toxin-antitoxin module